MEHARREKRMDRDTESRKETVYIGGHHVRFEYDVIAIRDIDRSCGSESVKNADSYLRAVAFRGNMYCAIVDEVAFVAGTFGKDHFRLAEIAVKQENQGQGIGRFMINMIRQECYRRGKHKITLRTAKDETAHQFYQKIGGSVVGIKGNDYEIQIIM